MPYVTASQYNTITGGAEAEATTERIRRASRLMDVRVGNYKRLTSGDYSGYKLDLDTLADYKVEAVKDWVAWMIYALNENNDSVEVSESVKLGRFSVTKRDNKSELIPDALLYADQVIKDAGLVKLGLEYTN